MRETATVIHRNNQGSPDYVIVLTFEFCEESGQFVGLCLELGTSAFADTLQQARLELQEAVELQLNEVERLGFIDEYFSENHVRIVNMDVDATTGFAVAGEVLQLPIRAIMSP